MKKVTRFAIFILLVLAACQTETEKVCEDRVCTEEFRSVGVRFLDNKGELLVVNDYQSLNKRTGKVLHSGNPADQPLEGYYTVASDSDLRELSEKGDVIVVSARHPETEVLKETQFVVSGGRCACHISKISGPEQVTFE
ncbi:hypothetical protein [Desertivirga xinjiangensis]|uniref:hypothetical protein n=1 Tax=Desertivirga xinjiangensis TaxID=539206 RepID=UPI00210DABE7|nr:hypothetical protein [Pedobacter xinjiangensis]